MESNSSSQKILHRVVPALALLLTAKLLDTRKAKGTLREVDSYAYIGKRRAGRAIRRIGRNATSNPVWLAAGAAAFAVGIGLMAMAGRSSKR